MKLAFIADVERMIGGGGAVSGAGGGGGTS